MHPSYYYWVTGSWVITSALLIDKSTNAQQLPLAAQSHCLTHRQYNTHTNTQKQPHTVGIHNITHRQRTLDWLINYVNHKRFGTYVLLCNFAFCVCALRFGNVLSSSSLFLNSSLLWNCHL